jgi:hypothetical protein
MSSSSSALPYLLSAICHLSFSHEPNASGRRLARTLLISLLNERVYTKLRGTGSVGREKLVRGSGGTPARVKGGEPTEPFLFFNTRNPAQAY